MTEDIERLIERAIDLEAGPQDWRRLEEESLTDPDLWRRLADALRLRGELNHGIEDRIDAAAAIELPDVAVPRRRAAPSQKLGWLAAAAMLLWIAGPFGRRDPSPARPTAAVEPSLPRHEASPREIEPLPSLMLETIPMPGGGFEVVYVRRTIESVVVDDLIELPDGAGGDPVSISPPLAFTSTEQL